ncbi:exocyst complex component 3-like protein [Boleophthalmus pectinirostris]|uniref:exocyst complex component 3-like protein n=1 Tax=Boleophthalmus pectinirostris TaxID=150288 RepID=UPI000A1C1CCD|nr:exocyst complex component 3-like protein [Boleophthalmus pectinirostris]
MSIDEGIVRYPCTEQLVPYMREWPETERARHLAHGAALKWASGMFCQPANLECLGQYKKRESQRTAFIYTRLKSMVDAYIDGVGWGVEKLHEARAELHKGTRLLRKAEQNSSWNTDVTQSLEKLREVSVRHSQLLAAVDNLPRLYSVHSMVLETERLVESRRLLEAHARLMELERWQDDILWQLHGKVTNAEDKELVAKYFCGVGQLVDALGREIWAVISSALTLALQNPTPFVSAVRIVEREEALDQALLKERGRMGGRPLPPGRPRCWRACFFEVLKEAVSARFRNVSYLHTRGPGLAGHLSAIQHGIMSDIATVTHLLEHCVPQHYCLTAAYLRASHRCLHSHLAQVISWDLESGEIFAVLYWVLHTYPSTEMMGHPELASLTNQNNLGALISAEGLEELLNKYVSSVRTSVSEWMHKAIQVELQDWQREQEPETDHEGFYHTSLPTIITQMLEENSRVALMIGPSLQERIIQMGLHEIEVLLNRFREALVEVGKEHRKGQNNNMFYLHYLLASISNFIILKKSIENFQHQLSTPAACQFSRTPPNPLTALDRTVRRACCLVLEQLKHHLQPWIGDMLTRGWLLHGDPGPKLCAALEQHVELYGHVRPPCGQWLQEEARWLLVGEYVRTLLQKRLVCHSAEDRRQLAEQMLRDEQNFREIFHALDGDASNNPLALIPILADFFRLRDPGLLALDVSGLAAKYPDISVDHVAVLLDIRGDISRDIRVTLRDLLEQNFHPLPVGYRPIFTDILVPQSNRTFCLPTTKCA